VSATDIKDPRLLCSIAQIAEDDCVVSNMRNRVESFGVVTIGILRIPLVDGYGMASRESIQLLEQSMHWTAPLERGRPTLSKVPGERASIECRPNGSLAERWHRSKILVWCPESVE
jgi:hypothetical protein